MVTRWLGLGIAVFLLVAGGCGGGTTTASESQSYRAAVEGHWDQLQTRIDTSPNRVFDFATTPFDPSSYPSEAALSFLDRWRESKSPDALDAARRQLAYARSGMSSDGLWTNHGGKPFVARVSQARLIMGFYVAFLYTGEAAYRADAERAMDGLLVLERTTVSYSGKSYQIFYHGYALDPPHAPTTSAFLNPNQDASVALAATMLAFEPSSKFFQDTTLRQLAKDHLDAAVALQASDGRIPEQQAALDVFDSRYGGWTLFQLFWANHYWQDAAIESSLRRATVWLDELTQNNQSNRFYPETYSGPVPDMAELNYRLPLLYAYGTQFSTALAQLRSLYLDYPRQSGLLDGIAGAPFLSTLVGVPRSAFGLK